MTEPEPEPEPGSRIVALATTGTAVFTVAATAAAIAPDALAKPVAVLDGALFAAGIVAFLWAYGAAIARSRTDLVSLGGVFFLSGTAPRAVRRRLTGALAVQVAVALVTASVRLYTPLAFGVLVPVFGLGLTGLWGARYGQFAPRPPGRR